jgi:Tfp pilus assembly protein PilF
MAKRISFAQTIFFVGILTIPILLVTVFGTFPASSSELFKALIQDAIQELKNNDIKTALANLKLADEQVPSIGQNQTSKIFVEEAIQELKNNDVKEALHHLNLI